MKNQKKTLADTRVQAHKGTATNYAGEITPEKINVLIACEESQSITMAFRNKGFNAYSCDLQKARFAPQWHILGDVSPYLEGCTDFETENYMSIHLTKWHLIIAHPPCTYLCKVSSILMVINGRLQWPRFANMIRARRFFMKCLNAQADFVAVENPLPMARACLPRPSTFICPSWFGVKYTKKTLLWLRNLPPIFPTVIHSHPKCFVTASRGKYRSRTFPQVAEAIAEQWGSYILDEYNKTPQAPVI